MEPKGSIFVESSEGSESIYGRCIILLTGTENCGSRELRIVRIIRAVLGFKAETAELAIMNAAFSTSPFLHT